MIIIMIISIMIIIMIIVIITIIIAKFQYNLIAFLFLILLEILLHYLQSIFNKLVSKQNNFIQYLHLPQFFNDLQFQIKN